MILLWRFLLAEYGRLHRFGTLELVPQHSLRCRLVRHVDPWSTYLLL